MKLEELADNYTDLLWSSFLYDYEVFSKPWLYAWLIPASIYLGFFFIKWVVLTLPLWGPVCFATSIPIYMIRELKDYKIKRLIKYTEEQKKKNNEA